MLEELSENERRQRLRLEGYRSPEKLPDITPNNFDEKLWVSVNKPRWNIKEASYYLLYCHPDNTYENDKLLKFERIYFWLLENLAKEKNTSPGEIAKEEFSPGFLIRYEFENYRPIDLKICDFFSKMFI